MTISEVEEEAGILHKEIDKAVAKARRKFRAAAAA
jgi:hypothetical protein